MGRVELPKDVASQPPVLCYGCQVKLGAVLRRRRMPAIRRHCGAARLPYDAVTGAATRLAGMRACAYRLVKIAMATGADTPLISTTAEAMCARPSENTAQPSPVVRTTAS
jgi:hypothetical protein